MLPPRSPAQRSEAGATMFCGEQSIMASSHFGQVAAPVKCKRWGCPNCQDWRQRCLQARCIEGKPNRFVTFTCRRDYFKTKEQAAKAMVAAWRTIIQRWRRLNKWHKVEYIAVFEPHTSGWPHMHILWKGHWLDQKWLSKQAEELLNSPIQFVSMIRDGRSAAFYVAKYFSKEPQKFGTCKRYWCSKHWPKLRHIDADRAFHKGFPIELVNKTIKDILETWKRYEKVIWELPPNVIGWGALWAPGKEPRRARAPPWNHTFGFQVSSTRGRRARHAGAAEGHD
jgi:hypothetical protein